MTTFEPIGIITRSQQVFDDVKKAIFEGKFKPGEPLRELQLAREFQVSQSTIREALIQLEMGGYVVRTPHRGTSVVDLSDEEITERLELRYHLEELAYSLASEKMTEADYKELQGYLEEINEAVKKSSYPELVKADLAFHRYIWEKSGNRSLVRTLEQITVPLLAYLGIKRHSKLHDISAVLSPHEKLIEAIKSGNPKLIRESIADDANRSYKQYIPEGKNGFRNIGRF